MIIALDIGHADGTGAFGVGGASEHSLCTVLAYALQAALQQAGHVVQIFDFPALSNSADLNASIKAINAMAACDLVISLHMDASDNAAACGAHVIYTSSAGKLAADCIAPELAGFFPGRATMTVKRSDLAILNQTKWPAVLCENGFITNAGDCSLMTSMLDEYVAVFVTGVAAYAAKKGASA